MLTSIIIPTFNKLNYTIECIDSIRKYTQPGTYEIVIVDNGSTDGTRQWLANQEDIRTLLNANNEGFPKACNQGIEYANGENILLLNNDTVVTKGWLDNLLKALYSNEKIGAVGTVTNSAAYYTSIPVNYRTIEEMHNFASNYNNSDPLLWEERLKLIGYCMLIKKNVVNEIGLLDERFTPGNFEDDDYSLRIRERGYKLLLCKDTFIHHYGSVSWRDNTWGYDQLLSENEKKFMDKWGTNSYSYIMHNELINEIDFHTEMSIRVLHFGCDAGGTLLKIRDKYRNVSLTGVEENARAASEAGHFTEIFNMSYEDALEALNGREFDVILITNWNNIKDLNGFLWKVRSLLHTEGLILASVLNATNVNVLAKLIKGENPYLINKMMSFLDIDNLFIHQSKLRTNIRSITGFLSEEESQLINLFCTLSNTEIKSHYEASRYLITAKKYNEKILENVVNIYHQNDVESNLKELKQHDEEVIIEHIVNALEKPIQFLQALAIMNYSFNYHESVVPYLSKAYELDPTNSDTLYNLGTILYSYQEKDLAKKYLELLKKEDKDEVVGNILTEIYEIEQQRIRSLIYLLRRIEFEIELEESKQELANYISRSVYSEEEIMTAIITNTINKEKMLNTVATISYENNIMDSIFPYLNKAYELNSKNDDTLFNLGYMLVQLGDSASALSYFEKISNKDQEVQELIQKLKDEVYE
ncbi:glycosyltransferase [Robertmurraya yapensis]|uniref:Glycosyltransferase n=1 Tax=Bacillus yapensis TaxID=2492960 RepID=A0A431WL79_9BACI|nr:glycosyltransferase [Bacillus yapensis]RTR36368.1 glycosyltransferase [Bacillus yapensis]TKT05872.1 glycosyltransferase [Bacillus yapensis]